MISPGQIAFRNEYRSRILGWYDGYFHIFIIYAMGAAAFYIISFLPTRKCGFAITRTGG